MGAGARGAGRTLCALTDVHIDTNETVANTARNDRFMNREPSRSMAGAVSDRACGLRIAHPVAPKRVTQSCEAKELFGIPAFPGGTTYGDPTDVMARAKRCAQCGAAMVYNPQTVIRIVFVVNRFGARPPDLPAPEVARGWSCTGCGSTVRHEGPLSLLSPLSMVARAGNIFAQR